TARKQGNAICFRPEGDDLASMILHGTVPLEMRDGDAVADFVLKKGDSAAFAFGSVREEQLESADFLNAQAIEHCFDASARFWRNWIEQSTYKGRWREIVN